MLMKLTFQQIKDNVVEQLAVLPYRKRVLNRIRKTTSVGDVCNELMALGFDGPDAYEFIINACTV